MTDVMVKFYGGPFHGQYLAVPERLPMRWRVPVLPTLALKDFARVEDIPESVEYRHAEYELRAIVNVETRQAEEYYYKFIE